MSTLSNAGLFLIGTVFNLYILILLLRLVLQWLGANYYNPVSQFIVKVTKPVVMPFKQLLPRFKHFDLAIVIVLLLLEVIKFSALLSLHPGASIHIGGLFILSGADLLKQLINLFFYAILMMVIISWVNPTLRSPVIEIMYLITEPLMRPARRFIPPIAGFDISPIPVLIGLQLIAIVMIQPILNIGSTLTQFGF